jgi:hypothetical protein
MAPHAAAMIGRLFIADGHERALPAALASAAALCLAAVLLWRPGVGGLLPGFTAGPRRSLLDYELTAAAIPRLAPFGRPAPRFPPLGRIGAPAG